MPTTPLVPLDFDEAMSPEVVDDDDDGEIREPLAEAVA